MDEPNTKTSVYLQRSTLKRLKDIAFDRRVSVNTLIQNAINEHILSGSVPETEHQKTCGDSEVVVNSGYSDVAAASSSQEFHKWLSYLSYILKQDHREAVQAVKTNLIAFVRLTDLEGGKHEPPPEKQISDDEIAEILDRGERARANAERFIEERKGKPGRRRKAS